MRALLSPCSPHALLSALDAPPQKAPHSKEELLSPKAIMNVLEFAPTKRLTTRVCAEWNYLAESYVLADENGNDLVPKPPESFPGTLAYNLMLSKMPQREALRALFTPGERIVMYGTLPRDLIPAIAKVRVKFWMEKFTHCINGMRKGIQFMYVAQNVTNYAENVKNRKFKVVEGIENCKILLKCIAIHVA